MSSDKHYKWWYHHPGMIYAGTRDYTKAMSKQEVLDSFREEYNGRLPKNFAVWPFQGLPKQPEAKTPEERYANLMWM